MFDLSFLWTRGHGYLTSPFYYIVKFLFVFINNMSITVLQNVWIDDPTVAAYTYYPAKILQIINFILLFY